MKEVASFYVFLC